MKLAEKSCRQTQWPTQTDRAHSAWLANLGKLATKRAKNLPMSTLQIANLQALSYLYDTVLKRATPANGNWKQSKDETEKVWADTETQGLRFIHEVLTNPDVSEEVKEEFVLARLYSPKMPPHSATRQPRGRKGKFISSVAVVET